MFVRLFHFFHCPGAIWNWYKTGITIQSIHMVTTLLRCGIVIKLHGFSKLLLHLKQLFERYPESGSRCLRKLLLLVLLIVSSLILQSICRVGCPSQCSSFTTNEPGSSHDLNGQNMPSHLNTIVSDQQFKPSHGSWLSITFSKRADCLIASPNNLREMFGHEQRWTMDNYTQPRNPSIGLSLCRAPNMDPGVQHPAAVAAQYFVANSNEIWISGMPPTKSRRWCRDGKKKWFEPTGMQINFPVIVLVSISTPNSFCN